MKNALITLLLIAVVVLAVCYRTAATKAQQDVEDLLQIAAETQLELEATQYALELERGTK